MSKPLDTRQYSDAKGQVVRDSAGNILLAQGTTVPSDGAAGYSKGALFFDLDAAAGSQLFVNEGSATSADFNAVLPSYGALAGVTATVAELNTLHSQTLTTGAGAGVTGGTGTVYKNSVQLSGGVYYTSILIDLTGLASSTTDLDIIGVSTTPAHLGQITAAQNGTLLGGRMTCLEVPAGGIADIDLYWATEATGKFDDAIVSTLTETVLITAGGNWTLALTKCIADPVGIANGYLYLTGGAAGTAATYTAGKFLIELFGT